MSWSARPTLIQLFLIATLGVAAVAGGLFFTFDRSSRASILERSTTLRDAAALDVGARVASELGIATKSIDEVERSIRLTDVRRDDPLAVETLLFTELVNHPTLSEISFIAADEVGYAPDGAMTVAPEKRSLIATYRPSAEESLVILTRRIFADAGHFVSERRQRAAGADLLSTPFVRDPGDVPDPTLRPAFVDAARRQANGTVVWTDLHFSPFDASLPAANRRVAVDAQRAIHDGAGRFLGVVRVGLLTQTIDALTRHAMGRVEGDPRRAFLCDSQGRLVTRMSPDDAPKAYGDDARIDPATVPPPIVRALGSPAIRSVTAVQPLQSAAVDVGGERFLATFLLLGNTPAPGWRVGIMAPQDYYTADLEKLRDRFLEVLVGVTLFVLVVGALALRTVNRALYRILAATTRMRRFDFEATHVHVPFRDIEQVIEELERAKTAMRALSKYVPIDVVRELHESNRDPVLGGELREVSIMFSDIRDFTTLSEGLAPDELAQALGRYLQALTGALRTTGGTIDKFIGDAVMTFWNAPTVQASHAKLACRAALACVRAARELYASPAWGRAPLYTRYGIHRAKVMVGHFGSPERMSYTALGDGVNVASRLEGLCKQYDVEILVSQAIVDEAADEFLFRRVDRVAVKGKHEPVSVYELLGTHEDAAEHKAHVANYEEALEAYFRKDFAAAIALLQPASKDGPSRVLYARCLALQKDPPPSTWSGIFVATAK